MTTRRKGIAFYPVTVLRSQEINGIGNFDLSLKRIIPYVGLKERINK